MIRQSGAKLLHKEQDGWSWRPGWPSLAGAAAYAIVILLPFIQTYLTYLYSFGGGYLPDWNGCYLLFRFSRNMALISLFWMLARLPLILGLCALALVSGVLLAPALRRRVPRLGSIALIAASAVALGAAVGASWNCLLHLRGHSVSNHTLGAAAR